MTSVIAGFLFTLFLLLALLHIYWSVGGRAGTNAALPVNVDHKKVIAPRPLFVFMVGLVFAGFGFLVLTKVSALHVRIPLVLEQYGLWGIAILFIARAVGDFYYVGFFKRIKHTRFGRHDSHYYTPLSLCIGVLSIILELSLW